ncbi:MAG TPA: phosphatase PAP2 family protein [Gemmatimonadales bacterium]|jgi:membrane-associated phospholipid phosphatase
MKVLAVALLCRIVMLATPMSAQRPVDSARTIGIAPIVVTAGALAAAFTVDAIIARHVEGSTTTETLGTARQLDRFGDVTGMAPIIGGLAVLGIVAHDRSLTRTAALALGSVATATVVTQATKYVVGRVRPYADPDRDGSDLRFFAGSPSFPSGHTAAAFALATSLGDATGHTWARIGFYVLATGTGWARITEQAHWLSDVVAGAAVGIASAKWASGRLRIFGLLAPRIMVGHNGSGLAWTVPIPGP